MERSCGLVVGAFVFSACLVLMGAIHFSAKKDRCPTDCRSVDRFSGTGCSSNQCYCADAPEKCQPRKPTLTTHQRRAMRLLYGFVLVGLGIIVFFSICLCCRADGPTSRVNPPEGYPSLDVRANFPVGWNPYNYEKATELMPRY